MPADQTQISPTPPPYQHITVIGTGLIGGSLLLAMRQQWPTDTGVWLQAIDPNPSALQQWLAWDAVDSVSRELPKQWADNHLIVLACHLPQALEALQALAALVKGRDITVSDVGSCKLPIVTLGQDLLPGQFVGGHPLAGKEFSGFSQATSLLYHGQPFLFCPSRTADEPCPEALTPHLNRLKQWAEQGLCSRVGIMPADAHDHAMAFVSHFPQLYATLLSQVLQRNHPENLLAYHGGGIDGQLRLAASPYTMWGPVFQFNRDALREVIGQFRTVLDEADAALASLPEVTPDALNETQPPLMASPLAQWFTEANALHQRFHRREMPVDPNARN